jgi:hypothetical protein
MWVFDGSGQSKWIVIGGLLSFGPAVAATVAAWRIRRTADGWKLAQREIRIHQNVLLAKNLSIFF